MNTGHGAPMNVKVKRLYDTPVPVMRSFVLVGLGDDGCVHSVLHNQSLGPFGIKTLLDFDTTIIDSDMLSEVDEAIQREMPGVKTDDWSDMQLSY